MNPEETRELFITDRYANDTTEICNHAEFLDVMSRTEMLAMYFVHDGGSTSDWRLKGHAKQTFWDFVSTWAVMLNKPSDIGFSDEGYLLPPLNVIEEVCETPKRDNGMLFNDIAVSATDYHKELRATAEIRLNRVASMVKSMPESTKLLITSTAVSMAGCSVCISSSL